MPADILRKCFVFGNNFLHAIFSEVALTCAAQATAIARIAIETVMALVIGSALFYCHHSLVTVITCQHPELSPIACKLLKIGKK